MFAIWEKTQNFRTFSLIFYSDHFRPKNVTILDDLQNSHSISPKTLDPNKNSPPKTNIFDLIDMPQST
jgi:hypothetical protein